MHIFQHIWIAIKDFVKPVKNDTIKEYPTALPTHKPPNYPAEFQTDGCSGGMSWAWKKFLRQAPPWEQCCVKHDLAYWRGGFWKDRQEADLELMRCVKRHGHPVWAFLMFIAVRVGGSPLWPVAWRWGYGWQYTGRYEKRTESERIKTPFSRGQ